MEQVEASIERHMLALETADRKDREIIQAKTARLKDKIAALKEQMKASGRCRSRYMSRQTSRYRPTAREPAWSATRSRRQLIPPII